MGRLFVTKIQTNSRTSSKPKGGTHSNLIGECRTLIYSSNSIQKKNIYICIYMLAIGGEINTITSLQLAGGLVLHL